MRLRPGLNPLTRHQQPVGALLRPRVLCLGAAAELLLSPSHVPTPQTMLLFPSPVHPQLMRALIEAGAAAVHFEDQLASAKKCGHLGGKVLVSEGKVCGSWRQVGQALATQAFRKGPVHALLPASSLFQLLCERIQVVQVSTARVGHAPRMPSFRHWRCVCDNNPFCLLLRRAAAPQVPTREFVQKLTAARLAADVMDVPTVIIARTDALGAYLLTSDADERDKAFMTGGLRGLEARRSCRHIPSPLPQVRV